MDHDNKKSPRERLARVFRVEAQENPRIRFVYYAPKWLPGGNFVLENSMR